MYADVDSLGNYLRRERELQHVSLQDISAATKIQLRFLKALENDAYDQLPPAPFVVGFLRAYAQYLALDPEEIVAVYHAHYGTPDESERQRFAEPVQPSQPSWQFGRKGWSFVLVILVIVVASIWGLSREGQDIAPVASVVPAIVEQKPEEALSTQTRLPVNTNALQSPITEASPEPVVEAVAAQGPIAPPPQDDVQMAAASMTDPEVVIGDGTRPNQLQSASAPTAPETTQPETPSPEEVYSSGTALSLLMLQVTALEDTWLRVEIDGEQRHTLLLVAGKSIEWEADERFMLTVGNAHGTRLVLNGRDVSLPSTRNNVVRDFILTRNMVN